LRPQGFYIFVSANETNPILRNQAKVQTKKNPESRSKKRLNEESLILKKPDPDQEKPRRS